MNNEPQQHPAHPNEVQQLQPHEDYHVAPPIVGSAARRNAAHQVAHQHITPEMMEKHDLSKRKYPHITLSRGEYVIEEVRRHPIGLFSIWGVADARNKFYKLLGWGQRSQLGKKLEEVGFGVLV